MSKILLALILSTSLLAGSDREMYGDSELLSEIFIKRKSGTNFEARPLTEEQMQALIQSARWAPSSFNDQPWNFIFCDRFTTPEAYSKVQDAIYGQDWVEQVSLFVIVVVRSDFLYNGKANDWAQYDTGAAAMSMSLQAADLGLASHQIGGFDREEIQQVFQIPEGFSPLALIAIGHEDPAGAPEEEPRTRRPTQDNFFLGEWGRSFSFK